MIAPEQALSPNEYRYTADELKQELQSILAELTMTPADLTNFMRQMHDNRDSKTTLRSIQRMLSGESRVSGEMIVIAKMLQRRHRRLKQRYGELNWVILEHGVYTTQVDEWHVFISPQSRGRWILSCRRGPSRKDYSPPFGRWLDSLEEAKNKALACVEEGMNDWAEFDYE